MTALQVLTTFRQLPLGSCLRDARVYFQASAIARRARGRWRSRWQLELSQGTDKPPPLPGNRGAHEDLEEHSGVTAVLAQLLFWMLKEGLTPESTSEDYSYLDKVLFGSRATNSLRLLEVSMAPAC